MVDDLETFHREHGWIAVDMDGTFLKYNGWVSWCTFGEPIQPMVDRMLRWIHADKKDVRIFTARVGLPVAFHTDGRPFYDRIKRHECKKTGEKFSDAMMVEAIWDHIEPLGLPRLRVQCYKDVGTMEIWDDRCVQVVPNEGVTVIERHSAELLALRTPPLGIKEVGQ